MLFLVDTMARNVGLTDKGDELLNLIEPELDYFRLRDVIDYEVDCIKKSYEMDLLEKDKLIAEKDELISEKDSAIAEKDELISEKDSAIAEKDEQIRVLTAKLKENGII